MDLPKSSPLIVGLTIVFLGAMAFAIPEPAIEKRAQARGGYLVGKGQLSDVLAEQKASEGYAYFAVDLTGATVGKPPAHWVNHLNRTAGRRFPIWGWLDTRGGIDAAAEVLHGIQLAGLYVWGPDSRAFAAALRAKKPGLEILPVLREGESPAAGEACAIALSAEAFPGDGRARPVLIAGQLDYAAIEAARSRATGDYLIATVPVR